MAQNGYCSTLILDAVSNTTVDFYPLDDFAGFVEFSSVKVNGEEIALDKTDFNYMPKVSGHISIPVKASDVLTIECIWRYKKILDAIEWMTKV